MALGDFGISVSPNTVARLLHKMGYSLRINHKILSTDFSADRNDQLLPILNESGLVATTATLT